jgi:glycosyltransferase involved in cell wall biosynthesis
VKISVIVPAFNEERLLGETLGHIKRAMTAFVRHGWETELIVCDNNSTDRTSEIAREAGAAVVFEPINQIGRARNCGAVAATGDWLVFVDADSHPSGELFEDVAEQIGSGRCLAGGSTVKMTGCHPMAKFGTTIWNWISRSKRWLAGSFIFCDSKVFREIGGFSNDLFISEELELSNRLHVAARETGRKLVILRRHPLLTSDRKMRLYTLREQSRFLFRVLSNYKATTANREACYQWYDGRR